MTPKDYCIYALESLKTYWADHRLPFDYTTQEHEDPWFIQNSTIGVIKHVEIRVGFYGKTPLVLFRSSCVGEDPWTRILTDILAAGIYGVYKNSIEIIRNKMNPMDIGNNEDINHYPLTIQEMIPVKYKGGIDPPTELNK